MVLYSAFFRIDGKDKPYIKPNTSLNSFSIGVPILKYEDNYAIHSIIMSFRDNMWLSYHQCAVRLLTMNCLPIILNKLEEGYDELDADDKEYIDKMVGDMEKIYDHIEYDDLLAYMWIKD